MIYYAEPVSAEAAAGFKRPPGDGESLEARWVSLAELKELGREKPGLRGGELPQWARYLEEGGEVFPLKLVEGKEGTVLDAKTDKAFVVV